MKKTGTVAMVASLGIITVIAGALLGGANELTADAVARSQQSARVAALSDILPEFDNNPADEASVVAVEGDSATVYTATLGGAPAGSAVEIVAHDGFSGDISLMFGFDADGVVTGYKVLAHGETPGLGARMEEWFRDTVGSRSVIGIDPAACNATVVKDGGEIDGITAATITSRAFLAALRRARNAVTTQQNDTLQ